MFVSGQTFQYRDANCERNPTNICVFIYETSSPTTITLTNVDTTYNWLGVTNTEKLSDVEGALADREYKFWSLDNCSASGCNTAQIYLYRDGKQAKPPFTIRNPNSSTSPACSSAVALGPWQPTSDGKGQDITIDSGDGFVHADFWRPQGPPLKSGFDEISVIIDPGIKVTVVGVAGQGWKYGSGCSRAYVEEQVAAHQARRRQEGKKITTVNLSELPTK